MWGGRSKKQNEGRQKYLGKIEGKEGRNIKERPVEEEEEEKT